MNLYTYTYNNPLIYRDPSGHVVETLIDIASIGWSAYDLYKNPSWKNAGFLLWDIGAALLPFLPGSYTAKGVNLLMKADDFVKAPTGVWAKKPFERGWEIEKALGGMMNNFPVIDKFTVGAKGIASSITSIKSIDVTAKTYQKGNNFYNTIKGYVDDLANFSTTTYGGVTVKVNQNTSRILELALPPVQLTKSQADQLDKITKEASKKGVKIVINSTFAA